MPVCEPWARYADLLMHQQLVQELFGAGPAHDDSAVGEAIVATAWARETAHEIEVNAHRYWLRRYLERRIGEEVEAVVLAPLAGGCYVELEEVRLWTFCPMPVASAPPVGARLRLAVSGVSARGGTVHLAARQHACDSRISVAVPT